MPPRERDGAPPAFRAALAALRAVAPRPDVVLAEAPAPQRLAPWAVALTADLPAPGPAGEDGPEELATGRVVVLHDPAGQEAWQGAFRVVTFLRADLDPEMVADPMLPEVGWDWLLEALQARGAEHVAASGTVTRVVSESFGAMVERPATAEVEIRASWTPVAGAGGEDAAAVGAALGAHLGAWCDLLRTAAGQPPLPDGVAALPARRRP
ncbi:DUF3000 domain-containing protein [Frankiales bacterium YIM 75000]|uniref:DUF3000 domain-containing protein n=1 Tax=Vallicoccus soli TaxID=2339232 RepID=A0A3A3YQK2_9ACTN|nr:DUF3000 domain-containing protein [Vallicoccus soli]